MKIRKGDTVKILQGKDKGKTGQVSQVLPAWNQIVVEGANKMKRHLKGKSKEEKGQVVEFDAPLHISNVAMVCPKCQKATRVKFRSDADKKVRVCSKCQEVI